MGRQFVIGDIHGAYRALMQCLELADFDVDSDRLICLGDVCDGWPETRRCIDQLLRIKNLTYLLGNHDTWLLKWMTTGSIENIWYVQGGEASIVSYADHPISPAHIALLQKANDYFQLGEKLFVHAGILPGTPLETQSQEIFLWDRTLARMALNRSHLGNHANITGFEEIYIGHTPITQNKPMKACEVWLMDTGAGWEGVLSMMNIETKEMFVSERVPTLYPGVKGRSKNF